MRPAMFRSALLLTLLATPAMTTPAMAFQARNGVEVTGSADQIVVQPSPGQAAPQSWCAAGDFVIRGLGLPATTPVYRVSPPPRRGGQEVIFSLSSAGASDRTGLIRFGQTGSALIAAHAQSLCWNALR